MLKKELKPQNESQTETEVLVVRAVLKSSCTRKNRAKPARNV